MSLRTEIHLLRAQRPACVFDERAGLKARNDTVELVPVSGGAQEGGNELNLVSSFSLIDFEAPERIIACLQLLPQKFSGVVDMIGGRREPNLVDRLGRALFNGCPVDRVDQRTQERIAGQYEAGQRNGLDGEVRPGTGTDGGGTPKCRSGIEALGREFCRSRARDSFRQR
jgi:hypothetical protein